MAMLCSRLTTFRLNPFVNLVSLRFFVRTSRFRRSDKCKRIQVDEIWAFTGCKNKNVPTELKGTWGIGDTWTGIGICADCRVVPTWLVAPRHTQASIAFMEDLASRLTSRVQLTSDGHTPYLMAVDLAFGKENIDYEQLNKIFDLPQGETFPERKYSPGECCGERVKRLVRAAT